MINSRAKFFEEIVVIDPDTKLPVHIAMFKHENGGIFGIDSSYYIQEVNEEGRIQDPLNEKGNIELYE